MYYILCGGPCAVYKGSWEECEDALKDLVMNRTTWYQKKDDITQFLRDNIEDLYIVSEEEFDRL